MKKNIPTKMRKLAILLATVMALSMTMTACGNDDDEEETFEQAGQTGKSMRMATSAGADRIFVFAA